jgi:hypothetical protein
MNLCDTVFFSDEAPFRYWTDRTVGFSPEKIHICSTKAFASWKAWEYGTLFLVGVWWAKPAETSEGFYLIFEISNIFGGYKFYFSLMHAVRDFNFLCVLLDSN